MAVAAILDFSKVKSEGKILSGMLLLVRVPNLVRICAVATAIWPINCISKWRPPPSYILSKVKCEGKTVFRTSVLVSTSNVMPIRAIATEL